MSHKWRIWNETLCILAVLSSFFTTGSPPPPMATFGLSLGCIRNIFANGNLFVHPEDGQQRDYRTHVSTWTVHDTTKCSDWTFSVCLLGSGAKNTKNGRGPEFKYPRQSLYSSITFNKYKQSRLNIKNQSQKANSRRVHTVYKVNRVKVNKTREAHHSRWIDYSKVPLWTSVFKLIPNSIEILDENPDLLIYLSKSSSQHL